jgi:hypothetical protein
MTRILVVLAIVCAAATAHAQQADVAERWVGTWTGKATWKKCTTAGPKKLALDLTAARGLITVDGDQLMDGLGAIDFVTGLDALSAPREDLSLTITWTKKGAKLVMKTGAGCTAKATLTRATSGIPSCDALLALRTVEASCRTTEGDVAADRKAWKKLTGKKKKAQAAQCTTDADTLRTSLGDGQCLAASTSLAFRTGLPGCDEYIASMERYLQCEKIPQAARDAARQGVDAMKDGWAQIANLPDDVKQQTNDACKQAVDALKQGATALGCKL